MPSPSLTATQSTRPCEPGHRGNQNPLDESGRRRHHEAFSVAFEELGAVQDALDSSRSSRSAEPPRPSEPGGSLENLTHLHRRFHLCDEVGDVPAGVLECMSDARRRDHPIAGSGANLPSFDEEGDLAFQDLEPLLVVGMDVVDEPSPTRIGPHLNHQHGLVTREPESVVLDRILDDVADVGGLRKLLPLPDRQSEVLLLAKWLLGELDRQRDLVRLLEKEGDHLADVRDRLSGDLVDAGYRWTADYGRSALGDRDDVDVEALAVVLVGGLVNYRRTQWTFGRPPLALSEERLVAAITTIVSLVLQAGRPETA